MPSADSDKEGIPLVLMEAMAMGLPVVSTRHSGIDELVAEDMSGLLTPEKDVSALAEKLLYLLDNPHSWHELARAARQCVDRKFNIDILNKRLEKIYQDMMQSRT